MQFVLDYIQHAASLDTFKKQVRKLTFDKCPCKMFKRYIQEIRYLDEETCIKHLGISTVYFQLTILSTPL